MYENYLEDQQAQKHIDLFYQLNPDKKKSIKIKRVKFALTKEQRLELLGKAFDSNMKHYTMIKLQLETGLRVGEVLNLIISAINFKMGIVTIESRKESEFFDSWNPKSIAGNRSVSITKEVSSLLKAEIGKRKRGYVFLSNKQKNIQSVKKTIIRVDSMIKQINKYAKKCKTIGKNIGSHTLRRTYASYLLKEKADIGKISKTLGHKTIQTTLLYLYDIEDLESHDKIRALVEKMNVGGD